MIAIEVDYIDDRTPPVSPAEALRRFQATATTLAETFATMGDWPSLTTLDGPDAACVRDRLICAEAFAAWAIEELGIVRETFDRAAGEGGER